jgi:hypothetical protein
MNITVNEIRDTRTIQDVYRNRHTDENGRSTYYWASVTVSQGVDGVAQRELRGFFQTDDPHRGRAFLNPETGRYARSKKIATKIRVAIDLELATSEIGCLTEKQKKLAADLGKLSDDFDAKNKMLKQASA